MMNDVSGMTQTQARHGLGVAILVDGENVSFEHAEEILSHFQPYDRITVKRVYGNIPNIKAWEKAPGFRPIHSHTAKNSADILLAIEAMELSYTRKIGTFVIVSADGDHSHLAKHLVERDFNVIGMSQQQANDDFQSSCTRFIQLDALPKGETEPNGQPSGPPAQDKRGKLDRLLHDLIEAEPDGLLVSKVNGLIRHSLDIKISKRPERTWPKYFARNAHLYICDPKGPNARVRLKQAQTSG
jgi:uncharacterized LabA/DUF88 family protein